ncbi:MAG: type II secretion system protein [Planctomycetes bacterium]|nr:type II secretion system protein [Planctomycetota bacterium]MCB9868596.1 type II secretion system protein [Planctomycetota bacterium]
MSFGSRETGSCAWESSTECPGLVSAAQRGFTILELTVAMGLLSVFMMFLIQIMLTTTEVFHDGQQMQELASRGLAARRPAEEALRAMTGPTFEGRDLPSDARLLVQWAPLGLDPTAARGHVQVLRATVRLSEAQERQLLERELRSAAEAELGQAAGEDKIAALVRAAMERTGLRGRADMLLLPWPTGDAEKAYLELRRGRFLPGRPLPYREANGRGLMDLREFGPGDLPAARVPEITEVIASGLLYVGFRCASQKTRNWVHGPDSGGPESVWDSARAGWSLDAKEQSSRFSLDIGETSARDSTDDVFPHYIELLVVAGSSSQDLPESSLAEDITADEKAIRILDTDRLPNAIHGNFIKIGSEWVQFGERHGGRLSGVRRGQRGTTAKAHERGTGVRIGRTEVIMLRVPHARDSFNG